MPADADLRAAAGDAVLVIAGGWWPSRSRLGFALRVIGEDEMVARHSGIDTTRVKVLVFATTSAVMARSALSCRCATPTSIPISASTPDLLSGPDQALLGGIGRRGAALARSPGGVCSSCSPAPSRTILHRARICFVVIVFYLLAADGPRRSLVRLLRPALRRWREVTAPPLLLAIRGLSKWFGGLQAVGPSISTSRNARLSD